MKITIVGPLSTEMVKKYLDNSSNNLPRGDGGYSVVSLVIALIRKSIQVTVLTYSSDTDTVVEANGKFLKVIYVPQSVKIRSIRMFRDIKCLVDNIKLLKPEFVHAHWTYEYGAAAILSGYPNLVTVRDDAHKIFFATPNIFRLFRLFTDWYVCKKAKYLSANSPDLAEVIEKRIKRSVIVLPNFILDEKILSETQLRANAPSRLKKITMLNNGFSPWKNTERAMLAFNELLAFYPEFQLHMYGQDFEEGGKAHHWVIENAKAKNIKFYGLIDQTKVSTVLDESTIFLHTSLIEGFGLAPLEAMARGVPVVGGKESGAIPWLLDYGKTGVLCDVRNTDEIIKTMKNLLDNQKLLEIYSNKGLERAHVFSEEKVVADYIKTIKRIFNII
ncbi:MAG: glycosyltransferase family 4 protein [Ignavibacteriaceae bacterium]